MTLRQETKQRIKSSFECMIPLFFKCNLSSSEKRLKNSGLKRDPNHDICDNGCSTLPVELSGQLIVLWDDDKPVDDG